MNYNRPKHIKLLGTGALSAGLAVVPYPAWAVRDLLAEITGVDPVKAIYLACFLFFLTGFAAGVFTLYFWMRASPDTKPDGDASGDKADTRPKTYNSQSGNIFFALFGAVALVGVLGAATMTIMKGPVRSMAEVTKRTVAENAMIAAGRLALSAATQGADGGDCDGDGYIEPVEWSETGTGIAPVGGGFLPSTIGAAQQDPWGTTYGYCAWDHGATVDDDACGGAAQLRLAGEESENYVAIAVISAGSNRTFETSCADTPDYLTRVGGSDDVILEYTYGESAAMGLWRLKAGDPDTAEIGARNIEIAGSGGADIAKIGYDADLDMAGVGEFLAIKTDSIYSKTAAGAVGMQSPLRIQSVSGLDAPGSGGGGFSPAPGLECDDGEIAKWDTGVWICAEDGGGGEGGGGGDGESDDFNGMIVAFAAASCPSGWSEYTPARGRFLRGIDNGAGNDPDGTRAAGATQTDAFQGHKHDFSRNLLAVAGADSYYDYHSGYASANDGYFYSGSSIMAAAPVTDGTNGTPRTATETRPKNVAVIFCSYDGPLTITGAGGGGGSGGGESKGLVVGSTSTSVPTSTETTVVFDTVGRDDFTGAWSGNKTFTVPSGEAGWYQLSAYVSMTANAPHPLIYIRHNGVVIATQRDRDTVNSSYYLNASAGAYLAEGATVEVSVYQASGGSVSLSGGRLSVVKIGGGGGSDTLSGLSCSSGEIAKWNGTAWACAADGGGSSGTEVAFRVHKNGTDQTIPTSTYTKLTWSTEEFDTNDNFASDRFTPTVAGKYQVSAGAYCNGGVNGWCIVVIYKNGGAYQGSGFYTTTNGMPNTTTIVDMNGTTDYLEVYAFSAGGTSIKGNSPWTNFSGSLIGGGGGGGGGGGSDTLSSLSCTTDQVAKWNGSAWACANENAAAGQEVAFSVHKNNVNQTVVGNTYTKMTWSTEDYDTNDNFASDRFTPTVAGKYLISLQTLCQGVTGYCLLDIQKNGAVVQRGIYYYASASGAPNVTAIIDMNGTTDYIEAWVNNNAGTVVHGNPVYSHFAGALISPDGAGAAGDSVWSLNGTKAYYSAGNVGIGTSDPGAKLDVNGSLAASTISGALTHTNSYLVIKPYNGSYDDGDWAQLYYDGNANRLRLYRNDGGTDDINLYINGTVSEVSDIRLKKDIVPVESALERLSTLEGVSFKWKSSGEASLGVIAQEVQKAFPELVTTDEDGTLAVNYSGMAAPIVEAIKELKTLLDDCTKKVAELFHIVGSLQALSNNQAAEISKLKDELAAQRTRFDSLEADNDNLRQTINRLEKSASQ